MNEIKAEKSAEVILLIYTYIFFLFTAVLGGSWAIWNQYIIYGVIVLLYIFYIIQCDVVQFYASEWFPFLFFILVYFIVTADGLNLVVWGSVFLMLFAPVEERIFDKAFKAMYYIGLFFAFGCFLQKLYPKVYFSTIYPLFNENAQRHINNIYYNDNHVTGFVYQTDHAAQFITMAFAISIFTIVLRDNNKQVKVKYYELIGLAMLGGGVLLTGKRADFAFALLGLFAVYVFSSNREKGALRLFVGVLVGYILITLLTSNYMAFSKDSTLYRIGYTIANMESEDVLNGRTDLYDSAKNLFLQHPILGVGWDNFKVKANLTMAAHNVYLQLLCETGIIGFSLFVIGLIFSFFKTIHCVTLPNLSKNDKMVYWFCLYYQIYFIFNCFVSNPIYNDNYRIIYFLTVVICSNDENFRKKYELRNDSINE